MSEVKKQMLSHAAMNKLYRDKKAFIVNYGESMGVWTNKDASQCKFYKQEHSPGGAGVSWSTDGRIFTLPSNSANDVDAAQFVTIDFGSSKNKVVDGANTQSYLNRIGSVAATGAKYLAAEGAKYVGKQLLSTGAKAGAAAAGTAVLSAALRHPEIFPSGVQPFVPVADFAVNTVGKAALGAGKHLAAKYVAPLVKATAQAGWNQLVQPRIADLWNSTEPYLAATVGVPLAVYGAKKAFDGVKSGVQAIAGALKQPRVEEPSDVNEKDNMSYSSISTASGNVFDDKTYSFSLSSPSSTSNTSSNVIEIDDDSSWVSNGNVFERSGSPNSFYSINSSNSSPLLPPSDENLLDLPPPPPPPPSADVGDFYPDRRRVIFLSFFRLKN